MAHIVVNRPEYDYIRDCYRVGAVPKLNPKPSKEDNGQCFLPDALCLVLSCYRRGSRLIPTDPKP